MDYLNKEVVHTTWSLFCQFTHSNVEPLIVQFNFWLLSDIVFSLYL